jgi:hypothetical protein
MMKWVKERDLLIAQTMAFVQSVSGNKPDAVTAGTRSASEARPSGAVHHAVENVAPRQDIQFPRAAAAGEYRAEIQSRVANFRAHQEHFHREREQYFSATLAKIHAAIGHEANAAAAPPRK